jgi:beta-N-acetylhexosaminidase
VAENQGFQRAGVAATAKHFPGHGNTPIDTHVQLAVVRGPLDFLWNHDLVPFRAAVAAGVASVMVSHVKFEALDPVYPASLSPVVTSQLLRGELAFDGLVCTDCMEMNAITDHYGSGEAAVAAVLAGQDIVFYSHSPVFQQEAFDALLQAVKIKRIAEERIDQSLRRIDAMIEQFPVEPRPTLEIIRSPGHLAVMKQAADAAITVMNADNAIFPLNKQVGQNVGLVEFSSFMDTPALESGGLSALAGLIRAELPGIASVSIPSRGPDDTTRARARTLAQEVDVLLLATRNAHLWPDERVLALELIQAAKKVILICLADPYDADALPGADTIMFTCGDSEPLLHSALDVLMGRLQARGKLPVPLKLVS